MTDGYDAEHNLCHMLLYLSYARSYIKWTTCPSGCSSSILSSCHLSATREQSQKNQQSTIYVYIYVYTYLRMSSPYSQAHVVWMDFSHNDAGWCYMHNHEGQLFLTRPNFLQPSSHIALVYQSVCSGTMADQLYYDWIAKNISERVTQYHACMRYLGQLGGGIICTPWNEKALSTYRTCSWLIRKMLA